MPYIPSCPHCHSKIYDETGCAQPNMAPNATSKQIHDLIVERNFYRSHYDRAEESASGLSILLIGMAMGAVIGALSTWLVIG